MSSTNFDEEEIRFEQANIDEEALVEAYDASYLVSDNFADEYDNLHDNDNDEEALVECYDASSLVAGKFTDKNESLHDKDNNEEVHIDGNDRSTLFDEEAVNSSRNNDASIDELITSTMSTFAASTQNEMKKNHTSLERQISDLLERVRFRQWT